MKTVGCETKKSTRRRRTTTTTRVRLGDPPRGSKNNYKVDFTIDNSFRELLGFSSKKIETNGTFCSDNVIQISSGINSEWIHCDLIDGAYNDGIRTNTILSFSAYSTPIGYKFNMEPKNLVYLTVSGKNIQSKF